MGYKADLIAPPQVEQAILLIRGQRVMLDRDLAAMYGVTTSNLNKAVRRNLNRFPPDFMFQLTEDEAEASRFQIGILKRGLNIKYLPYRRRSCRTAPYNRDRTFLDCGGKRSATPLSNRLVAPQSVVAAALQSSLRFAPAGCHRTPNPSRHSVRTAIHI
jgi:hypothetical protein